MLPERQERILTQLNKQHSVYEVKYKFIFKDFFHIFMSKKLLKYVSQFLITVNPSLHRE